MNSYIKNILVILKLVRTLFFKFGIFSIYMLFVVSWGFSANFNRGKDSWNFRNIESSVSQNRLASLL